MLTLAEEKTALHMAIMAVQETVKSHKLQHAKEWQTAQKTLRLMIDERQKMIENNNHPSATFDKFLSNS